MVFCRKPVVRISGRSLGGFRYFYDNSIIYGPNGNSPQVLNEMTLAVVSHTAQEEARLAK